MCTLLKSVKDTIIKYNDIIFSAFSSIYVKRLGDLRKQQVIHEIVYRKYLLKDPLRKLVLGNIVVDSDTITDKRTGYVFGELEKQPVIDELEHRKKLLQMHQGSWLGLK